MKLLGQPKYINILALVSVLILAVVAFFADMQMKRLSNSYIWVEHTYAVINVADRIPFTINKLEIELRGFLLTKDKSYLDNFNRDSNATYADVIHLENLTRDNPLQQKRIQDFKPLVINTLQMLQQNAKQAEKNIPEAVATISKSENKHLLEIANKNMEVIVNEEIKYLRERIQSVQYNYTQTAFIVRIGNFLSIGLILVSLLLLNKQIYLQRRIERKLRKSEDRLMQLAYYNPLTNLPNRLFLFKKIDELVSANKTYQHLLGILFIDIDNFKSVNDSSGYELGDELIIQVSQLLVKLFPKDNFIAHLGGDKFVVVLKDIDRIIEIAEAAQLILDNTKQPLVVDKHQWFISVSIGISIFPNNGMDAKSLMKNADIAVYHAKELGKNNYQFSTPEMTMEVEERALLDSNLHKALVNKEFVLLYQPKVNLQHETFSGVELLIRWNRPKHGLVNPINFISLAESNGLIVPMGEWMLREACLQGRKWSKAGIDINISINISTRQLIISGFVASVKKILAETKFDPKLLEFEITESLLLEHSINNLTTLKTLKEMGIKITIDDFGTGYSSLSYLKAFDVDKLKIDKSFVDEITETEEAHSIIIAIIVMAHSLGIRVIAEGIEQSFQAEFLKKNDCDEGQGYYYSKPLPPDEVLTFVQKK